MNQNPWWRYLLIAAVLIPGFFYALPNLFGDDPGVQVKAARTTGVDPFTLDQVEQVLNRQQIETLGVISDEKGVRARFSSTEDQLKARDALQESLGSQYTIALTLVPSSPAWMNTIGAAPMYLGLDLRGGVHFLMEVDLDSAISGAEARYVDTLRRTLREQKVRYAYVRQADDGSGIEIKFRDSEQVDAAMEVLDDELPELDLNEFEREGELYLGISLSNDEANELKEFAVEQNVVALRNRIDELGVAEPVVQRQGDNRIVIQLPGVQDTARAKRILGRTATLEIHMVDEEHDLSAALTGSVPIGSRIYNMRDGSPILLQKSIVYSGDNIVDAAASLDTQTGGPIVSITLDSRGAAINQRVTGDNIGKRMGVVYIESRSEPKRDEQGKLVLDDRGDPVRVRELLEEVITAPVIRDQLGRRFQIEGLDSVTEARDLALLLRAGALAAPVDIIEERTVGPSLGQQNIVKGLQSVLVGFVLVLLFMAFYYRTFGLVANLALGLNLILIVAVLSALQATLTLPGVAGIVLTVGIAVDSNVLIFERIREELRNRNSPQASIQAGYEKAFSTIVDANITTLIAAIVLFNFGTGPIKGFAVTLSIGIITSMFTAILGTRTVINLVYGTRRRIGKLAI
jgi:preprotein translocase subunit SecD